MNKKLFNVLLFTAGAAIGSLVTWKVVKTRYEQIIQEEIDSFKETYALCMGDATDRHPSDEDYDEQDAVDEIDEENDEDAEYEQTVMTDYAALASKYGRSSGGNTENSEEGEGDVEVPYINGPYVIPPDEYGDGNYDHDLYCLTYYADGVLANDWWETMDVDETIGLESVKHFGDYADDVVHVRNERLKADYEVALDPRNYADMVANDPLMRAYAD